MQPPQSPDTPATANYPQQITRHPPAWEAQVHKELGDRTAKIGHIAGCDDGGRSVGGGWGGQQPVSQVISLLPQ